MPKSCFPTNDTGSICSKAFNNNRLDKELTSDSDDVSTCSSSTNSTTSRTKNVSFSNLEVKYFTYDLGDSNLVKDGPPLTISWDSFKAIVIPIEKYESVRELRGPVRVIHSKERMNILLREGMDISLIEDAMEEIRIRRRGGRRKIARVKRNQSKKTSDKFC